MVSGIYICHWPDRDHDFSRCEVLLHRSYHNDVPAIKAIVESYSKAFLKQKPHERGPFLHVNGISYISLWAENDILLMAVAHRNINASSVISLLSQLQQLIIHYFSAKKKEILQTSKSSTQFENFGLKRETIIDNYALIFELLDECVDFGLPQVTDYNILKEYIKMEVNLRDQNSLDDIEHSSSSDSGSDSDLAPKGRSKKKTRKKQNKSQKDIKSTHNQAVRTDVVNEEAAKYINSSIVRTQVSSISWRPKGIFYPKNEIYIDIIEDCEFHYDLEAQKIRINQVNGVCLVRSYLSGMPVCKLGLNEKYISQVEYDEVEEFEEFEEEYLGPSYINEENQLNQTNKAKDDLKTSSAPSDPESKPRLMKVPITNVQFHSCVELATVYKDNLVFFTPPDDEFRLFSYTVEQQRRKRVQPLLLVKPIYQILKEQKKLQILCTLNTNFRKRLHCNKVIVRIPVDPRIFLMDNSSQDNFRFKCEMGEVSFVVDSSEILWAIPDLPGSRKSVKLMAELMLSDSTHLSFETITDLIVRTGETFAEDRSPDEKQSTISDLDKYYGVGHVTTSAFESIQQKINNLSHEISVSFEMPMFTYSGLKVTFLRVDEDTMKYTCFPWVRYATRAQNAVEILPSPESAGRPSGAKFRFKLGPSNFIVT